MVFRDKYGRKLSAILGLSENDYVQKADLRIVLVLVDEMAYRRKHYCFPSMARILRRLQVQFGVSMSVRALCRHLGALTRDGYLERLRRHCHNPKTRKLECHSTLYKIRGRASLLVSKILSPWRPLLRPFARESFEGVPVVAKYVNPFYKGKLQPGRT